MVFTVFGIQPSIALAECAAVFPHNIRPETATPSGCYLDVPASETTHILQLLAMSTKVVGEISPLHTFGDLESVLTKALAGESSQKVLFGISVYNLDNEKETQNIERIIPRLSMSIKKELKTTGASVRVISGKSPRLSSVQVATNHLLDTGKELVILVEKEGFRLGITKAVQDFKSWSRRDFGRPARDAKSGMLPPKLARLLVNLTAANPLTDTLLDPFCGSGTVLMEAALLGFTRLIGSDISEKAIEDSETNMAWLKQYFPNTSMPDFLIEDAGKLPRDLKDRFHAVATEVFLGEPQSKMPSEKQARAAERELTSLYKGIFEHLFTLARPGTRFAVAFPAFATQGEVVFLPMKSVLEKIGYTMQSPLPANSPEIFSHLSPSGGLLYKRKDQFVWRDIVIFHKP